MGAHIRELAAGELDRIREIDRSESARLVYVHERGELRPVSADLEIPTWDEACRRARERGAEQLYISASDTESAVGFYLAHGCRPAEQVDPVLYELEPADIHLTLDL